MANDAVVDKGRRRFLTATTAVVGGAGVVAAAIPFIKSWEPSAAAKSAGAPVEADISKIEPGQKVTFAWRGLPVFVVNRTKQQLDSLASVDAKLKDPKSDNSDQQPKYAQNEYRSIKPEWLVVTGARAQYKGTGTINGAGNYGFMLTAIDGQINGGGGMDKFRIKIWDKNNADAIIYDNQMGLDDDGNPTTTLGGGSIVIHK